MGVGSVFQIPTQVAIYILRKTIEADRDTCIYTSDLFAFMAAAGSGVYILRTDRGVTDCAAVMSADGDLSAVELQQKPKSVRGHSSSRCLEHLYNRSLAHAHTRAQYQAASVDDCMVDRLDGWIRTSTVLLQPLSGTTASPWKRDCRVYSVYRRSMCVFRAMRCSSEVSAALDFERSGSTDPV